MLLFTVVFFPKAASAVRPLFSTLSFVAGGGGAGFQDGSFTSALFNTPLGMAISPDGTQIFVADSENNRIRVIHLDQDNLVTTLTGQKTSGNQNGSLNSARFNHPKSVACLPEGQLVVTDNGNNLLRLVDIKKDTVSTLGGDSSAALVEGPSSKVSMAGIQNIVYLPAANSVFFSQPDQGTLKRLDLKTGQVTLVPSKQEGLNNPAALCVSGSKLYVADQYFPKVFACEWTNNGLSAPVSIGEATATVLALTASGDFLYAIQAGEDAPLQRLLPKNEPVSFMSVWGDNIPKPGVVLHPFINLTVAKPVGFVSDLVEGRKLYISNPWLHRITSYRDVYGDHDIHSNERLDELPLRKAPKTFRILIVGDSRSRMVVTYPFKTTFNVYERATYPPQVDLCKRLEFDLNTLAALDGEPMNFEVMNLQTSASEPLFLWPTYRIPDVVRLYDIDLVIIMYPPTPEPQFPYTVYFTNPITSEGIPKYPNDMEYLLKPPTERIPPGEPRHFYDMCKSKKLVSVKGNSFLFDENLFLDPEFHDSLVELYGKPLGILNEKISTIKTSTGEPVHLLVCSMHGWMIKPNLEDPKIWVDVTQKRHIPFLDMNDEMTAMETSYYPLAENGGNDHFNVDGHFFFSQILAHDLIRDKLIPWK